MCPHNLTRSHQAQFKQIFQSKEDGDANVFQTYFVPQRLTCNIDDKKNN